MQNEYNEKTEKVEAENEQPDYAYMNVMRGKENSRSLSVASLLLAVASLICSFLLPILGVITGGGAIVTGAISRKNIGYFDRPTLFGIFGAIFSILFSLTVIIIKRILT